MLYKNKYRIETTRLKDWDYSSEGYYFITVCTKNREILFGKIIDDEMALNDKGKILYECWFDLPGHYNNLELDEFIIMPNHIHGIIVINNVDSNTVEKGLNPSLHKINIKKHGLFEFVRAFKTFSCWKINKQYNTIGKSIWQTGFYDRIIRNEEDINRIREYIHYNPLKWDNDEYYVKPVEKP